MDLQLKSEIASLHAQICSALSDPNRILILCLLSDEPRNVSFLSDELQLAQPTVSRHLKVLRERGLVYARRQGQFVVYELADHRIITALQTLRAMVVDMLREQAALAHTVNANPLIQQLQESEL